MAGRGDAQDGTARFCTGVARDAADADFAQHRQRFLTEQDCT